MTIYQGHTQIHNICIYKQRFLYLSPDFFSVIPESTQCYVFQSQLYHSYKLFVILKMYEVRIINAAISYIKYRKNIYPSSFNICTFKKRFYMTYSHVLSPLSEKICPKVIVCQMINTKI